MTDDRTIEEFVRRLAKAYEMKSWETGPVIDVYWRREAEAWVEELDKPGDPDYDDPCSECGQ